MNEKSMNELHIASVESNRNTRINFRKDLDKSCLLDRFIFESDGNRRKIVCS